MGTLRQQITNVMFMKFQTNSELCYFHNGQHCYCYYVFHRFEPSTDDIKMQDCQVYSLNK